MTIFHSILSGTVLLILLILVVMTAIYLLTSFEKGDLKSYQENSGYSYANLSKGLTAYKDYGDSGNPIIIVIHGATLPSEGYVGFCEGLSLSLIHISEPTRPY